MRRTLERLGLKLGVDSYAAGNSFSSREIALQSALELARTASFLV